MTEFFSKHLQHSTQSLTLYECYLFSSSKTCYLYHFHHSCFRWYLILLLISNYVIHNDVKHFFHVVAIWQSLLRKFLLKSFTLYNWIICVSDIRLFSVIWFSNTISHGINCLSNLYFYINKTKNCKMKKAIQWERPWISKIRQQKINNSYYNAHWYSDY